MQTEFFSSFHCGMKVMIYPFEIVCFGWKLETWKILDPIYTEQMHVYVSYHMLHQQNKKINGTDTSVWTTAYRV